MHHRSRYPRRNRIRSRYNSRLPWEISRGFLSRRRRNPYRRNLIPLQRREELRDKSPGNFRRPTLAVTENYLQDWKKGGISSPDDFALYQFKDIAKTEGTTPAIERAKERNRFEEAQYYWDRYSADRDLFDTDPNKYSKPRFSFPVTGSIDSALEDVRDYGDYAPVSTQQAYDYLYQFLTRNAENRLDGITIDDVRAAPFKWRYRDAVLTVSPEVATKLVQNVFSRVGLRAPKWYLPENLYDDLGELFPEVEEAGEVVASRRRFSRRRLRRYNPWY